MIRVGVVGLGMMGLTHLDAYTGMADVEVTAIADANPARLSGEVKAKGNVEGQAQGRFDFAKVKKFADGKDLIRDADVDVVDICLTTPLHLDFALTTIAARKPLLIEKPLARTAQQADQIARAAKEAGIIAMPAMCMRFWPGWTWLKRAIAEREYGKVFAAHFRRLATHPGGAFYADGAASGAAALDLHIHDADFVRYCFGDPISVHSRGYSKVTSGIDHLITQYQYGDVPLVTAEGGWAMADGYPFRMQYTVNFERATAVFDSAAQLPLCLYEKGLPPRALELDPIMGYQREIEYFIKCVKENRPPTTVTLEDGAEAVRIVEAEVESIRTGWPVSPTGASAMTSLDQHLTDFFSQWGWTAEAIARLLFASVAGGAIGLERELRGREAGFRTNLLVCLGSSLVMIVSLRIPMSDHWTDHGAGLNIVSDPARIAYGVMAGIGFLGAGAIIRDRATVRGVTTAASLWCVTAIGLGLGSGLYTLCLAATTIVVLVLWLLEYVQEKLPRAHYRMITIRRRWEPNCVLDTIKHVERAGLRVMDMNFRRSEDLASADIELRTVFYSKQDYYKLERDLERDHAYKLISIQES